MVIKKGSNNIANYLSVLMLIAEDLQNIFLNNFEENYEKIFNYLYRGCFYRKEDAEDLTQRTFLNFLEYLQKYPDKGKKIERIKDFTFTIATNLLKRYFINEGKMPLPLNIEIPEDDQDPSEIAYNEKLSITLNAMKYLKIKERIIVDFKAFQDKTFLEISGYTDTNENTVKATYYRAVEKLKKIINGDLNKK